MASLRHNDLSSSEVVDSPHCCGFSKAKTTYKFEIQSIETLNSERSHIDP